MSDSRTLRQVLLLGGVTASTLLLLGCAPHVSALELTSHKDPFAPQTYALTLDECAYYTGPGNDYHIVGAASHTAEDGGEIRQYVYLHLFWKPWPGKTFDNPSSVDATFRYAIVTQQGSAVYSGTAFVYPQKKRLGELVIAKVEEARLRLDSQTGTPPDVLGPTRVCGTLVAEKDANLALDLRRQLHLLAGNGAETHQ